MNRLVVLLTLAQWFAAPAVVAQPWIGARGETTVSVMYQRTEHEGHVLNDGTWLRAGGSHASVLDLKVEHNVSEKFAVGVDIAYVAAKYAWNNGSNPTLMCPCPGLDDGHYHSTWQDVTVGARYNVMMSPVTLTPSVAVRFPTHRYATAYEAAPGRHLIEGQIGIAAGRTFALAGWPMYASAQYSHSFVEKVLGVSNNRSNADISGGVFLTPALSVHSFVDWQKTYGGLTSDFVLNFDNKTLHPALYRAHDGLIRDNFWRGGVGASYSLSARAGLFASIATVLGGTNTHYGYLYNMGVAMSFKRTD